MLGLMSDFEVIRYNEKKYENSIAIVGFPSVGLIGSILSSYISRELKMNVIAGMTASDLPPYAFLQNGIPYPPIRIYVCSMENSEKYSNILVITSEISPKPEQCHDLARAILRLLKEYGVTKTIVLEGVPQYDDDHTIIACGTVQASRDQIQKLNLRELKDGLIRGLTGLLLFEGQRSDTDLTVLMCPANPALPDPGSAATVLEPLTKIIPGLKLDEEPLYKEAEEIKKNIKAQAEHEQTAGSQQLYG